MPTAREIPPIEVLITEDAPSPLNPLGLKGAGEGGANAVGAAIAAAIDDALGMPGAVTELPVTPQRLRAALEDRNSPANAYLFFAAEAKMVLTAAFRSGFVADRSLADAGNLFQHRRLIRIGQAAPVRRRNRSSLALRGEELLTNGTMPVETFVASSRMIFCRSGGKPSSHFLLMTVIELR